METIKSGKIWEKEKDVLYKVKGGYIAWIHDAEEDNILLEFTSPGEVDIVAQFEYVKIGSYELELINDLMCEAYKHFEEQIDSRK